MSGKLKHKVFTCKYNDCPRANAKILSETLNGVLEKHHVTHVDISIEMCDDFESFFDIDVTIVNTVEEQIRDGDWTHVGHTCNVVNMNTNKFEQHNVCDSCRTYFNRFDGDVWHPCPHCGSTGVRTKTMKWNGKFYEQPKDN